MMATIANWAIVPPKLMPGVFRNDGVYNGRSANAPNATTPKPHFWNRLRPAHHPRRRSPGASSVLVAEP